MPVNAGDVYSELILDFTKYIQGFKEAEKQTKTWVDKLDKAGKNMEKVGKSLNKYVTLPIVGMGAASTKAAIDFESAFAGVRKTVDASEQDFERLEKGIRGMTKEIPASATAIAEVAEAAGQLGIETDNILGFTRVMIDLGNATNMSAEEAATSLARLANITGMSQRDFDKLGSAIVALGNNLATTEGEIVAMGLRLAGAGKQIGLTEAQIMSFAGALSSVGIEAEAGGSAFSKVMIDMQLAVETNSEALKDYANVAGMTASEFKQAFQEDAAGAIISFVEGLGTMDERGQSAIKTLDDMGITEVRMRDALLRASGASDVFTESLEMGSAAWEENTALANEAAQRYETNASKLEIMKNQVVEAGIQIGEILIPYMQKGMEVVRGWIDKFNNLNPKTQEAIVKIAGVAAAIGPLLIVGGKLAAGVVSITKFVGLFTAGAGAAAAATGGAAAATGGLGAALTALSGPVGWVIAGLAAVTAGGIALYNHLKKDSIPAVELFGDTISETTKEAVGGFLELEEEATISLNQLSWSGQEVTEEMKESLVGTFGEMKDQIVDKLRQQKEDALKELDEMLSKSKDISVEEKDEILKTTAEKYDEQIRKTQQGNTRIEKILKIAKLQNRSITEEERDEINAIKEEMKEAAVRVLSESEAEQLAILERLKAESGKISALQAAEVVKNSLEQKEKTIAEAEEEYNKRLKYAATLKTDGSKESEELANKIIEEAKRQRDESIRYAEEMHTEVVKQAQEQAEEHIEQIDWEIGEIKSRWERLKDWFKENPIKRFFTNITDSITGREGAGDKLMDNLIGNNARGTDFWRGGLTWVGEEGPELIELPRGTKIYPHQESMAMLKGASRGDINQQIIINSQTPLSPSEIARKNLQVSRQLAMEWGI